MAAETSASTARSPGEAVDDLAACLAILRSSCPWDRVQTHGSLRRHLLEETHEVLDVLDRISETPGGPGPDPRFEELCEELGDLLLQVVFHAHLANEEGHFDLAQVANAVRHKLIVRHPAIFAPELRDVDAEPTHSAPAWERAKLVEKDRASVMDGIPKDLPALAYAAKVITRSRAINAVPDTKIVPDEDRIDADELGRRLFALVRLAQQCDLDLEAALRTTARRVERAVRATEGASNDTGGA